MKDVNEIQSQNLMTIFTSIEIKLIIYQIIDLKLIYILSVPLYLLFKIIFFFLLIYHS